MTIGAHAVTITEAENAETVRRINAAFLEAGYGDRASAATYRGEPAISLPMRSVPRPVIWAALEVARTTPMPCWPCWSTYDNDVQRDCIDGQCSNPDKPRWPGRKILVTA